MYGQFCMIHKETDTVLAMTAVTGDMQGEMNVYYEEVLLHYPNQPLADFFDLTLSCENDLITLTDKEGEIRYLAGRGEWKKTYRKVHCTPFYMRKDETATPVIGAWGMKDGSLVIKVYEIEMLEEDTLTLTPEEDGVQVKLVNTKSAKRVYFDRNPVIYFLYFQAWKIIFLGSKNIGKQPIWQKAIKCETTVASSFLCSGRA